MPDKKGTCVLCSKEFFYDAIKRKRKYCSLDCYRSTIKSTPDSNINSLINTMKGWIMDEKEMAKNLAVALGIIILIVMIWLMKH